MSQISAEYFKISPEMICIANLKGEFIEVNPAWTKVLGWELSEILNKSFTKFVHPDDLEMTLKEVEEIHNFPQKITSGFENRYKHKDGSYRWLQWVEINVAHNSNSVSIKVVDSGLGINDDIADKIMQPFFTTKEVGVGTGLGLSISKGIIEMHGGRFYLDQNCPNTSFVIELPFSSENH